jgi:hypothetical protein
VFIEVFFVFASGALVGGLGVKRLLLLAAGASAVRYALLAAWPSVPVAIGTQVFHGIFLVAVGVVPQMILDEHAGDRFRHSMQGLFVMVTGSGRVAATAAAGHVAAWSLTGLFACAAALCLVASALLLLYRQPAPVTQPDADVESAALTADVTPVGSDA